MTLGGPFGQSIHSMIWRDITQINAESYVLFSADSADARSWMRRCYGTDAISFDASDSGLNAAAFREAAEAARLSILVLAKRPPENP